MSVSVQGLRDAYAVKYITAAGAVILFYDHLLTIVDEYRYVWKAPNSIAKFAFLLNRYMVAGVILIALHAMSGFDVAPYHDTECQVLLGLTLCTGTLSCIMADRLMLHRVSYLWNGNKGIRNLIYGLHMFGASVAITMTALVCVKRWYDVRWWDVSNMCVATMKNPLIATMWSACLVFELVVVILVVYDTLAVPRASTLPFRRALQGNGIAFFLCVVMLRLINVIVATSARQTLAVFGIYFIWTGTTTFLSRSFLRLRAAEVREVRRFLPRGDETGSTFGPGTSMSEMGYTTSSQSTVVPDSASINLKSTDRMIEKELIASI